VPLDRYIPATWRVFVPANPAGPAAAAAAAAAAAGAAGGAAAGARARTRARARGVLPRRGVTLRKAFARENNRSRINRGEEEGGEEGEDNIQRRFSSARRDRGFIRPDKGIPVRQRRFRLSRIDQEPLRIALAQRPLTFAIYSLRRARCSRAKRPRLNGS